MHTASGRQHHWYRGEGLRNRADLRPGVDARAAGGYIVAPPSVVAGNTYRHAGDVPPVGALPAPSGEAVLGEVLRQQL